MEKITSKENRLVKQFVRLSTSKKEREETGLFALEGVKLALEAARSGLIFRYILLTDSCLSRYGEALGELTKQKNCYRIAEELEGKLSQQKTPQGIYAVAEKLDKSLPLDKIKKDGRYVLLADLQDSGNVGTIFRTSEAFGVDGVILTRQTCDPYSPKTLRGSMGSVFRLPILRTENGAELVRSLTEAGVATYASVLSDSALPLGEVRFSSPAVLLIGNEGNGLDPQMAAACQTLVTIPMAGPTESLNASMAAGILLWEMTRDIDHRK